MILIVGWLAFGMVVVWARQHGASAGRGSLGPAAAVLYVFYGPFWVAYYLLRTRADREPKLTTLLSAVAFAPIGGWLVALPALTFLPIYPRYLDFGDGRGQQRVTAELGSQVAHRDFGRLVAFLGDERIAGRGLPADADDLYARWSKYRFRDLPPFDPFTGAGYYYEVRDNGYGLWSAGPDHRFQTDDDLWFVWPPE
jgi:hypothetical protein